MALLALADLHEEEAALDRLKEWVDSVEALLIAGDVASDRVSYAEDLVEIVGEKGYFVPGNNESGAVLKALEPINIHGRMVEAGSLKVVGFGYSNITPFNTPGDRPAEWWREELKKLPKEGDVLLTHVPPYGILDKTSSGVRVGCKELRAFVEESSFSLHLFGHVHERVGFSLYRGKAFINLPPAFSLQGLLVEGGELSIVRL